MMFQVGDDGVVSSVNEEDLIYVDKNELDKFVESYHKLEKENKQLEQENEEFNEELMEYDSFKRLCEEKIERLKKENEQLKTQLQNTSAQRNEFHRGVRENANRVGKLEKENEQLKYENENLKITINARDTLIEVCEKKFRELGFIITVDDDGYVIE